MTQKRQSRAGSAPRDAWSYKAGEKGRNRVRVFDWPGEGIWIDYRENGKRIRKPLGHSDQGRAKQVADDVAAGLGKLEQIEPPAALTLRKLFEMYEREVTPTKATSTQQHDRRAVKMALQCWGAKAEVASLDRRDWDRFIQQRRKGTLGAGPARDGTIAQNLRLIVAVMHWAESLRVNGRSLLERTPFHRLPVPKEMSPRRPAVTEQEFQKLRDVAAQVDPLCALFLAVAHEVGHRMNAIAQLRWSDVDLAGRVIRWREANDKVGFEHTTPISAECAESLKTAQRERRVIGDAWIFPSPRDASKPASRYHVRDWWRQLEARATEFKRVPGRGWHSLRRKFATEHMDVPTRELMALGGWKSQRTIVECYQQPRDEKLREALERRSASRRATGSD